MSRRSNGVGYLVDSGNYRNMYFDYLVRLNIYVQEVRFLEKKNNMHLSTYMGGGLDIIFQKHNLKRIPTSV